MKKGDSMNSKQSGFTLIELVMVIVILGIMAAIAIPKFVDLSTEAKSAALGGVKGAMASAMAVNYAVCSAGSSGCVVVDNCDDTGSVLTGGIPSGYTVAAANIGTSNGTTATCTVTQVSGSATGTFNGISAGH